MFLLQSLKDLALERRKASMKGEGGEHAPFLSMLLSDVYALAKMQQRDPTDTDAEKVLRLSLSSLSKSIDGDEARGIQALPADDPFTQNLVAQRGLIEGLLPAKLTLDEHRMAVRDAAQAKELEIAPGSIGPIMKALKAEFGERIDGAIVKTLLATGDC
ncbi:hypothetical protein KIKIMORA_02680 [Brevundimonas phage vB_BpoS-Kikimora]|uniref:Uncharacterized protein n=1 Tax=Brevundimonas phage vB_BpoS-Kikimora TaxID=2948601 RepID=A0A9E7SLD0_9CAUD|nr:hypothetical protein KIKIMORA_02680 [Brevundimonas phage vB_BpoS-Kikimora]